MIFGGALFINEQRRRSEPVQTKAFDETSISGVAGKAILRASGTIEGRTDNVELRARIVEQITQIHIKKGQWVSAGEVLLSLDSQRLVQERDLAVAMLENAVARQDRLENGFRPSEIETARHEYDAAMARLAGAEKAFARSVILSRNNAVSQQTVDDQDANINSLRAMAAATGARLETMELPPRDDDLLAATPRFEPPSRD